MNRYLFMIIFGATLLWNNSSLAVGELGEAGGVNDNPHNLSSLSTTPGGETDIKSTDTTQICIFCHTPHGGRPQTTLWSRPDPTPGLPTFAEPGSVQDASNVLGINDAGIVSVVNGTYYGVNDATHEYPNGASKLCLSCHDGVTAMGILATGDEIAMTNDYITGTKIINLAVSHPISFVYNSNVQTYLNALPTKVDKFIWPTTAYLDGNSRVQCTICHQPHQDTKTATYILPFWRGAGTNDATEYTAICNACHTTTYTNSFSDHNYP